MSDERITYPDVVPVDERIAIDHWHEDLTRWVAWFSEGDLILHRPCERMVLDDMARKCRQAQGVTRIELNDEEKLIARLELTALDELGRYNRDNDRFIISQNALIHEIQKLLSRRQIDKSCDRIKYVLRQIEAVMIRRELLGID